jgi:hypothetical protein
MNQEGASARNRPIRQSPTRKRHRRAAAVTRLVRLALGRRHELHARLAFRDPPGTTGVVHVVRSPEHEAARGTLGSHLHDDRRWIRHPRREGGNGNEDEHGQAAQDAPLRSTGTECVRSARPSPAARSTSAGLSTLAAGDRDRARRGPDGYRGRQSARCRARRRRVATSFRHPHAGRSRPRACRARRA